MLFISTNKKLTCFDVKSLLFGSLVLVLLFTHPSAAFADRPHVQFESYTFPVAYQDLWNIILETLRNEFVPLQNVSEPEGVIDSAQFPIQKNEYRKWVRNPGFTSSGYGTLHLKISRAGSEVSKLEIAADFQNAKRSFILKKGRHNVSTGVFENALASRIYAYLIAKKYPSLFQLVVGCDFRWDDSNHHYVVTGVTPNSFGEEQGFQNGDWVVKIDGQEITITNLFSTLSQIKQNQKVVFTLNRGNQTVERNVDIFYFGKDLPWLGMRAYRDANGFRVVEVVPNSPAERAGFQIGDVLREEQGVKLTSWRGYYLEATTARAGTERTFLIDRAGKEMSLVVTPVVSSSETTSQKSENDFHTA